MRLFVRDEYGINHYLEKKAYNRVLLEREIGNSEGCVCVLGSYYEMVEVQAETEIVRSLLVINCIFFAVYLMAATLCKSLSDVWAGFKLIMYCQPVLWLIIFVRENTLAEDFNDS